MKWYSKDNSTMINLDKVDHFYYNSYDDILYVSVNGSAVTFRKPDAEDIYKKLIAMREQKEVI